MSENLKSETELISNNLRLKTFPVAVKFLKEKKDFPEKTRQPLSFLGKKITICQAVSMARIYGWTVALQKTTSYAFLQPSPWSFHCRFNS